MKLPTKVQSFIARFRLTSNVERVQQSVTNSWNSWAEFWKLEWRYVSRPRLYTATALSAFVFFAVSYTVVSKESNMTDWKQVYTGGTYVGLVPNDPKIEQAMQRIALGYHVDLRFHDVHMTVPSAYDWNTVASLPTSAVAIVINGTPVCYTADQTTAENVIQEATKALTPSHLPSGSKVSVVGNISYVQQLVGVDRVLSQDAAVRYLLHPVTQGLSGRSETVLPLLLGKDQKMTQGPSLANGSVLKVQVTETQIRTVSVPYKVTYISDHNKGAGQITIVKKGKPGVAKEQLTVQYINGKEVSTKVESTQVLQTPVSEVADKGTNTGIASGSWQWPSASYLITSPFGWRSLGGGEFHPGIDIGCPVGTPIYASNNGVVEDAGWNSGGYGIWVRLNNGNGIETVYGHMSRVAVHAGQLVSKGQLLGYSGETGMATGPHLHYEVRLNGVAINPTPYM